MEIAFMNIYIYKNNKKYYCLIKLDGVNECAYILGIYVMFE